jgi:hypothetical protein
LPAVLRTGPPLFPAIIGVSNRILRILTPEHSHGPFCQHPGAILATGPRSTLPFRLPAETDADRAHGHDPACSRPSESTPPSYCCCAAPAWSARSAASATTHGNRDRSPFHDLTE